VVLASTSGTLAVSRTERVATEEDLPPIDVVGRWPYYLSKIYEERLVLEFGTRHQISVVVLTPSLLLGPGDERLSSTCTVLKFLQRDLPAMPNGGISFVDVRDAAEVFVAALDRGEVGGKHLFGVNMTMSEFFGRLERLSGVPAPRLRLPSRMNVAGARLLEKIAEARGREPALDAASVDIAEHWFWLDARKAERELGFAPRDPQETLQDTVLDLLARMPERQWPGTKGGWRTFDGLTGRAGRATVSPTGSHSHPAKVGIEVGRVRSPSLALRCNVDPPTGSPESAGRPPCRSSSSLHPARWRPASPAWCSAQRSSSRTSFYRWRSCRTSVDRRHHRSRVRQPSSSARGRWNSHGSRSVAGSRRTPSSRHCAWATTVAGAWVSVMR
jgi:hypothetical protein